MKNRYEIRGDITIIFLDRRDKTVLETMIDTSDLPIADSFKGKWTPYWNCKTETFYVRGNLKRKDGSKSSIWLHRLLTNAPPELIVDHINLNSLDNRRSINLRATTVSVNNMNKKAGYRCNKSGYVGVYQNSAGNWFTQLKIHHKIYRFGTYHNKQDAIEVVRQKRIEWGLNI